MKKFLAVVLVSLLTLVPTMLKAEEAIDLKDYKTLNFKETLESEDIKLINTKYSESENQIKIYMFRGQGCGFCKAFLNFLNSISKDYGKYFQLVSFETWHDQNNSELLDTVSSFLNNKAQGVPYIIIGENVFPGYSSEYDEDIKAAIKELYDSKNRADVFEAYNANVKETKKANGGTSSTSVIVWNAVFVIAMGLAVIIFVDNSNKKVLAALNGTPVKNVKRVEREEVRVEKVNTEEVEKHHNEEKKHEEKKHVDDDEDEYEERPQRKFNKKNRRK